MAGLYYSAEGQLVERHVFRVDSTRFCTACGCPRLSDVHWSIPTVHLNGTGKAALLNANTEAFRALSDTVVALAEATPHARDYYVQGDGAYTKALREHSARLDRVTSVMREIELICVEVSDAK